MLRAKTFAEYRYLVDQALIEVDELRASIEFETDGDARQARFLIPLDAELKRLKEALETNTYAFRDEDLPMMSCMDKARFERLAFLDLIARINDTHRSGLDTDD